MFLPRSITAFLVSATFLTSAMAMAVPSAVQAQTAVMVSESAIAEGRQVLLEAVRASVGANPALADGVGDRALVEGVKRAVAQHPELADAIVQNAVSIRPSQADAVTLAAQNVQEMPPMTSAATNTVVATPVAPPPAPPAAKGSVATGNGLGNGAMLGMAGAAAVAGVVGGVAALAGGSDSKLVAGSADREEYQNQYGLTAINANQAYDRGATGSGVLVAVLDSGLEISHSDIDDNISFAGYNFVEDNPSVTDVDSEGHGTHVSGTIAAERDNKTVNNNIHGVAYNSTILPIRIIGALGGDGDAIATEASIISGINYAVEQDAQVMNGSYGPDYAERALTNQIIGASDANVAAAYEAATDAGMILVFAAGNDYSDNPPVAANPTGGALYPYIKPSNADTGVYDDSGADYDFSGLEGKVLAVVAADEDGIIASFSNRCGVAADWCLAAPGVNVVSLDETGGYTTMSGTSMAAPHVTGAVAVLTSYFPELEPEEIVARILATANKSGAYGNRLVYGQGFLDLGKASRPIGSLAIATQSSAYTGASFALSGSSMNLGPAFGDSLQASLKGQKLAVFDQQKATFFVDMANLTHTSSAGIDMDRTLRRFQSRFDASHVKLGDDASLSYAVVDAGNHSSLRSDPALGNKDAYVEMAYSQKFAGSDVQMNYNVNPSMMYGIYQSGLTDANHLISRDAFAAPYLSFAKQGYSMGTRVPLSQNVTLQVGAFHGYPLADELRATEDRAESFGQMVELAYRAGGLQLFSQFGMMSEKQTFLGSRAQGAFDLDSGTQTSFAGVNGAYALNPTWSVVGSYYRGLSSPEIDSRSLFTDISDVQTESFSLGMLGHNVLRSGDSLGLLGNQPLRVVDGNASLSLASGRSRSGVLYKQDVDVNLAPTGRELNVEAFYHMDLGDTNTQLMSSMMYRTEPGHVENAPDEGVFLLQLQQPF